MVHSYKNAKNNKMIFLSLKIYTEYWIVKQTVWFHFSLALYTNSFIMSNSSVLTKMHFLVPFLREFYHSIELSILSVLSSSSEVASVLALLKFESSNLSFSNTIASSSKTWSSLNSCALRNAARSVTYATFEPQTPDAVIT